ncbi:cytosolic leucyl tRNA synthetase [Tieghemiomyces parasiticus]|uniref:leucine--tRNA ligase n=1 Tax=Tieghemiomyces parasiticus TaxID=78921 RepID=A0A9W8DM93_9FUNG|nr:cytosolic leucyl tRNA synthetase [Tieghemiomyces parasiticus]
MDVESKKTQKRDTLRSIEQEAQARWTASHAFEANAPEDPAVPLTELHDKYPKYFANFPFPYMNGRLHLGHAFSISKVEFATGFERLNGKNVLFPFGFHVTGMPIKTSADKIKKELAQFGPDFILPETEVPAAGEVADQLAANLTLQPAATANKPKRPAKVAAKATGAAHQFQIMQSMGIPLEEIQRFADPQYWLTYFPPLAVGDLQALGCRVDWRRSFLTTDANPYYDSFARWQFIRLKERQKIKFGKRYTIYSPLDEQPCMDHDRQSGEGVGPQEYTAVKMRVAAWSPAAQAQVDQLPALQGKNVFMVAATLRPETMYGQTNCFVGPTLEYGLYAINDTDVFVCTHRAARNLCYQGYSPVDGEVCQLGTVVGRDLVGTKVLAPLSQYTDGVYVLPMENVLATKGTGVVTSVPSDSPDDYATLQDLLKKPDYYQIDRAWVEPFPAVPVLSTPTYGDMSAPALCKQLKINSQKDRVQLAEAKELAYKEGFYKGTMLVGPCAGQSVADAKTAIRQAMIDAGEGFVYNEPEGLVMSRSGDECVVALCDQWYLDYGEPIWRDQTKQALAAMNTYGTETRNQFDRVLDWLNQWACARSFGLGSKVPWDPDFLIESLSDSTIYMAYYTVAHLLHGGSLDGSKPGPAGVTPEQMTLAVWDHIFLRAPAPADTTIPAATLESFRREFEYYYPFDLRSSGKDLIPNHLTFALYNHTAMFPPEHWPRAMRSNGHLLLNNEKMSKSTGNFMTLEQAVAKYGADATRLALADAGDSIEDANFDETVANAAILRLFTLLEWMEDVLVTHPETLRSDGPPTSFHDRVFQQEMIQLVHQTRAAYEGMMYKDALKYGFYEFQAARDHYREATAHGAAGMHRDLIAQFVELQAVMMAPFTPHWSEHIWTKILQKPMSITEARWPSDLPAAADESVLAAADYVRRLMRHVREAEVAAQKRKAKGKAKAAAGTEKPFNPDEPKHLTIVVASQFPAWQEAAIEVLRAHYDPTTGTVDDKAVRGDLGAKGMMKDKKVMPFVQEFKKSVDKLGAAAFDRALAFDEREVLDQNRTYLTQSLGYTGGLRILDSDTLTASDTDLAAYSPADPAGLTKAAEVSVPGNPAFVVKNVEA